MPAVKATVDENQLSEPTENDRQRVTVISVSKSYRPENRHRCHSFGRSRNVSQTYGRDECV